MTARRPIRWIIPVLALCSAAACRDAGPDITAAKVTIVPSTPSTLPSGTSIGLSAAVVNAAGSTLFNQPVTWTSSDPSIAAISTTGVVTGAHAGQASITASVGSIASAPVVLTVAPGAAARLVIRTQPAGAKSGATLTTQPVVDVQDAAGNVVTSSTATVTAVVATGGGAITGSTTAVTGGSATFTSLALSGVVGDRTLTFSAPGIPPVTSIGVLLAPGAPVRLVVRTQPLGAISNVPFTNPPVVELRDDAGNLASSSSTTVTAGIGNGTGALTNATTQAVNGLATFTGLTLTGLPGDRTLTFSAIGIPTISSASFVLSAAP